jgi:hypothetical protein
MAQVAGTCYGSDSAAVAAIASGEVGKVVSAGSVVYVVDAAPGAGNSITYTLKPVGGGTPLVTTASVEIPPCMLLDWSDGLALGWAVAGVWISVALVLHLREAAHT